MIQDLKLPLEKFVVGQYIWWNASRYFGTGWNVPGVIVAVDLDNNTFTVKTFDDMEETTLSIYTSNGKSEFRISRIEEVKAFLYTKISKFKMDLIELDNKKELINKSITESLKAIEEL